MNDPQDYGTEYSDEKFWQKVKRFARKVGRQVLGSALTLYYCLGDPDTPAWAKGIIIGALGYFIVPLDSIPDMTPGVGFSDDIGAIGLATATVAAHIKQEHRDKARRQVDKIFGSDEQESEEADPPA